MQRKQNPPKKQQNNSIRIELCKGYEAEAVVEYNQIDFFKTYCKINKIYILDETYLDKIVCKIEIENHIKDRIMQDINSKKLIIQNFKILSEKFIKKYI